MKLVCIVTTVCVSLAVPVLAEDAPDDLGVGVFLKGAEAVIEGAQQAPVETDRPTMDQMKS